MRIGREIGDKLSEIVAARRLTQGQVAYKAQLSQGTVSQLLNGAIKDPPIGTVLKVAKALDLTLDQILGITPLPIAERLPAEDEVRVRLDRLEDALRTVLQAQAQDNESVAQALEQSVGTVQPTRATGSRSAAARRKAK